ncbi:MAG: S8 family serine peptidase [Acidimicrobiales bacterium]
MRTNIVAARKVAAKTGMVSGVAAALLWAGAIPAGATEPGARQPNPVVVDAPAAPADPLLRVIGADRWRQIGWDGLGVVVAVIDTGFAGWDAAAGSGLVPVADPTRDINRCDAGLSGRTHGTDSAALIHHVAPKATLVRVCIDDAADLAAAVTTLIAAGDIDIVNMALGFYNGGPGDGTGGPGSPDDSARRAVQAGLVWVNAAGNEAQRHTAGIFSDPDGDNLHNFAGDDELGRFIVPPGAEVEIFLRWSEWGSPPPPDGFRLCLTVDEATAVDCLPAAQPERATPTTGLALNNPRTEPVSFSLAIQRIRGTGTPRLDLFFTEANGWEFPDSGSSLVEPAAVPGVLSVGAACPGASLRIHPASSHGPTLDGRLGVSLVAPAGTAAQLADPTFDCLTSNGATTVAAPHAAGALALLAEAFPTRRGAALTDRLLASTAQAGDPGPAGADPVFGHGLLALGDPPPLPVVVGGPSQPPSGPPSEPDPNAPSEPEQPWSACPGSQTHSWWSTDPTGWWRVVLRRPGSA